ALRTRPRLASEGIGPEIHSLARRAGKTPAPPRAPREREALESMLRNPAIARSAEGQRWLEDFVHEEDLPELGRGGQHRTDVAGRQRGPAGLSCGIGAVLGKGGWLLGRERRLGRRQRVDAEMLRDRLRDALTGGP